MRKKITQIDILPPVKIVFVLYEKIMNALLRKIRRTLKNLHRNIEVFYCIIIQKTIAKWVYLPIFYISTKKLDKYE